MTRKERVLKFLVFILCVWCIVFSLVFPKIASEATFKALNLCARRIVPSLFLFILSSKIFLCLGGERVFAFLFGTFCEKVLHISKNACAGLFFGLLCGYPTGAVFISDALARGTIGKKEAQSILPFLTAASPAFLIGTVGSSLFGSASYGIILFASQSISSVIMLLITRKNRLGSEFLPSRCEKKENIFACLARQIQNGGITVISICSFVTFFYVFSETVLCLWPCPDEIKVIVSGFFEISCGFSSLAGNNASVFFRYFVGGAMLGFSGVSVLMQSGNLVCEYGVSMGAYAVGKAKQALLCAAISFVMGAFYEKGACDIAFSVLGCDAPKSLAIWEFALVSVLILAVVGAFCATFIKILRFFSKK